MGKSSKDDTPKEAFIRFVRGLGENATITEVDLSDLLEPEPVYLDIVLRLKDRDYAYELAAEHCDDDHEYGRYAMSCFTEAGRYQSLRNAGLSLLWVGDDLPRFSGKYKRGSIKLLYTVTDLRELPTRDECYEGEKEFLRKLLAVHQSHPGLFRRLLKLPPEEHQKEFYRIAQGLGYSTVDLDEEQKAVVERNRKKAAELKARSIN
jgi:hypothetical protein